MRLLNWVLFTYIDLISASRIDTNIVYAASFFINGESLMVPCIV